MKFYESYLKECGIDVHYCEDEAYLREFASDKVYMYDPVDDYLQQKVSGAFAHLHVIANPNFLNTADTTKLMHTFYVNRRKELCVLIDSGGKPEGGAWSLDAQNRKKLPKEYTLPATREYNNAFVQEAREYCKKFASVGASAPFYYPTTFAEAAENLEYFIVEKFADFGPYQDAIAQNKHFLYHANISSSLNIGLLDLMHTIARISSCDAVPLNSKEGFLRQIIGWREFMLCMYKNSGRTLRNANFFEFKNKMPQKILTANTGLDILDDTLKKVKQSAYAHHIERLMVLGNLFLLLEIHPNAVHEYFMANFIDAYDWVMVGNVYAMSGFSDGGTFTTKPYIASSNYMLKMSDYKRGAWCEIVDGLYWSFMEKYAYKFEGNPRMQMQIALLNKMPAEKLQTHRSNAQKFKKSLGLYDIGEHDINRLIEMAWQDRVPFEVISAQYGISENQLKKLMRAYIGKQSYKRWRSRVAGRSTKHLAKTGHKTQRFQGPW